VEILSMYGCLSSKIYYGVSSILTMQSKLFESNFVSEFLQMIPCFMYIIPIVVRLNFSHELKWDKTPTRRTITLKHFKGFYLFTCTLLNVFQTLLCPSSGAFPSLHTQLLFTVWCLVRGCFQSCSGLRPEQDWKQHWTGHHTVNRRCVCSEGKAPDDGHNSARNMLRSVQVNK
jgi:hypothetical protein